MTMVKMIESSVSPEGIRVDTIHARYWRAIHSELMTHKAFGRNARSSRAVPSHVLLKEEMFIPQFGLNQPGMQSEIAAPPELQAKWAREWEDLAGITRDYVRRWSEEKMHKQHANRPLEWFGWIDVLITSVYWENFYALRISDYAQPEFDELARMIKAERDNTTPKLLHPGEWHLPYINDYEREHWGVNSLLMLSTARCARLSYEPFEGGKFDINKEFERYEKLVVSQPVHASPAEHQCTPDIWIPNENPGENSFTEGFWDQPHLHGNLLGWVQHRKTIPNEAIMEYSEYR